MRNLRRTALGALILGLALPALTVAADLKELLTRVRAVSREGTGNEEAATAWKELAAQKPAALPAILAGMDDASLLASNWLRAAVDAVAGRALASKEPLPVAELEKFLNETNHNPSARRIAYELLVKVDPKTPDRLLPGLLMDMSPELRRDAVARAIEEANKIAEKGDKDAAKAAYQKALNAACDEDQVTELSKKLKPLGVEVNLAKHLGFVLNWYLVTPFDNVKAKGFDVVYPPEKGVDLKATYTGKENNKAAWQPTVSTDPMGKVDLNKALGKLKGTIAYAYAIVDSPEERPVQVRSSSFNALKIWVNGKEVFAREEYHHGMRFDGGIAPAVLKKGRNEILIKVCQNEQTESWAQSWIFQLRLTDSVGAAVPFTQEALKPEAKTN